MDNNCDGNIDEGVQSTFYLDVDEDGFGSSAVTEEGCWPSDGYVSTGSDCDDDNVEVFPGANEVCDELDNDCNGEVDDGLGVLWYQDLDEDGYGSDEVIAQTCGPPEGYISRSGDCDDASEGIFRSSGRV